jgi:hypothetical protein
MGCGAGGRPLYVNARHDLVEERELYRGTQHRASVVPP